MQVGALGYLLCSGVLCLTVTEGLLQLFQGQLRGRGHGVHKTVHKTVRNMNQHTFVRNSSAVLCCSCCCEG